MNVEKIETGYLKENCYIISRNNTCLIVDPGDNFSDIKDLIGNKKVLAVLITHYHFDHVGALDDIIKEYGIKVIDHNSEKHQIIGSFKFEIINTKGHTKDAVSYYFKEDKIMFTGDFLFKENIGRCDLIGGNINEMLESIAKIKKYDKDIKIYPGHGSDTMLEYEFKNNPYMKGDFNE